MAIPAGVTKVVYGGTLDRGEVWECGFWVFGALPQNAAEANANAQLWFAQLSADDPSGAVRITLTTIGSNTTVLLYTRVYVYPAGGPRAAYVGEHIGTPLAGNSSRLLPLQSAVVVSERTGLSGRSNRGRMYLPAANIGAGGNGQLSTAQAQTVADGWATCFSDWNASGDNGTVVVVSPTHGTHEPVSQIIVDTRLDVQRRRANQEQIVGRGSAAVT